MYKCLISGGCSFAYGFNLQQRDKRYAQLLADYMKVELKDVSAAGMTNEFIAAATVSAVTQALRKYAPDEILVLVGWTTTERFEYFNRDVGRIMSCYVNLARHKNGDAKSEKDISRSEYVSQNLWDPSYGYYKLVHAFNYVYSVCKAHQIKCIHKHNVVHYPAKFPSIKLLHTLIRNENLSEMALTDDAIECLRNWSSEVSFQEFTMKRGSIIKPGFDTHPNERGNIDWAAKLFNQHEEFRRRSE